jgi:uncharacterized membrane protein HdeD (DUF308 family)
MDRKFVFFGLGWANLGLVLAIYMGITSNHSQLATHAHMMLLGFVVSVIYAVLHKLWLHTTSKMAIVQFYCHIIGSTSLISGLFLMFGQFMSHEQLEPLLSVGAVLVITGAFLMKLMFIKSCRTAKS